MSPAAQTDANYSIGLALGDESLRNAYKLRLEVFADEQGYDEDAEVDSYASIPMRRLTPASTRTRGRWYCSLSGPEMCWACCA